MDFEVASTFSVVVVAFLVVDDACMVADVVLLVAEDVSLVAVASVFDADLVVLLFEVEALAVVDVDVAVDSSSLSSSELNLI